MMVITTPNIEAKPCAGGVSWYGTPSEWSYYGRADDNILALLTRVIIRWMLQIVRKLL